MKQKLSDLWAFLQGKKTYLALASAALVWIANSALLLSPEQYDLLMKLVAAFFGVGVTSKVQKLIDALVLFAVAPTIVNQHIDMTQPTTNSSVNATKPVVTTETLS